LEEKKMGTRRLYEKGEDPERFWNLFAGPVDGSDEKRFFTVNELEGPRKWLELGISHFSPWGLE